MGAIGGVSERLGNEFKNAGAVLKNVIVPEPENSPTRIRKRPIADDIRIGSRVLAAIGFNNEPSLNAGEIDDIRRDRKLSTKTRAKLLSAQSLP